MRPQLILAASILGVPLSTLALGIRVPDQDPLAASRGGAFVATADDPSSIYYNPAGMTQLDGHNSLSGLYGIYMTSDFEGQGEKFNTDNSFQPVPQFFYVYASKDGPLAGGLGIYSPYGLGLKWPDDTVFDTVITRGRITYITFNPALAWRFSDAFSVGAGLTVNYANTDLRQMVELHPAPTVTVPGKFKFCGDDTDVGFNAGVLWQPHPMHSFGVRYHGETRVTFTGHSEMTLPNTGFRQSADAPFTFPQFATVGYSFRPTPEWNLEFDVDWTDWDHLNTVKLTQDPLPAKELQFNWTSSFMFSLGATRYLGNGYRVSAGYMYSQNSVPDEYFSPAVPDSDRHLIGLGVGHRGKNMTWDFGYQFGYGPPRDVSGSVNPNVDGQYTFISHAIVLSLALHL